MSSVTLKKYIDINKGSDNGTENLILKQAIAVTSQAKRLVAIDLGQLRNSLMYTTNFKGDGGFNNSTGEKASKELDSFTAKEPTAYVGSNVEYSVYEEYGTRKRKKALNPYLRPAIEIVQNRGKGEVQKILDTAMKKARVNSVRGL